MNRNIPYLYKQDTSVREASALTEGRKKTRERKMRELRIKLIRQWGKR